MSANQIELRQQALAEAVEDHRPRLLAVIRNLVRDQVEAEDVLQDVFTEFIETYDMGQAFETLGNWLARVAKNKVIDRFRRKKTRKDYETQILETTDLRNSSNPEEEAERSWLRAELITALELLPENQRDVFIKHELEGKSFEEIAKQSGASVNTLLARKRYAVLFLRNHLKEIYDDYE